MSLSKQPEKSVQGALIQLFPETGMGNVIPNIVQFDINPDELTRDFTPWKVDTENDTPAPGVGVQPITVPQKFSNIKIVLDPYAAKNSAIPIIFRSVEARLAALRKMIEPSKGISGDLVTSFMDLANREQEYSPPEISPILLWLGERLILPVRIETLSITEHQHDVLYYPVRATVTMNLVVMTPDQFHCVKSPLVEIAIAAYEYTRFHRETSATFSGADISPLWRVIAPI